MRWFEFAQNPKAIESLYKQIPDLENVRIISLCHWTQKGDLDVVLELPRYPDRPSERWHQDANAASVELKFFNITSTSDFKLPQFKEVYSLKMYQANGQISVSLESEANQIRFYSELYRIGNFSVWVEDNRRGST